MSRLPSMPFFWGDFFAATEGMSEEGAKAYLFLLGHGWLQGAKLRNDDRVLARLARLSPRRWAVVRDEVLAHFEVGEDGFLRQSRLTETYENVCARAKKNSEKGSRGGVVSAHKKINENSETASPGLKHVRALPNPKPKPEPKGVLDQDPTLPLEIEPSTTNSASDDAGDFPEPVKTPPKPPNRFDQFWTAYPLKKGKEAARKAFQRVALSKKVSFEELLVGLERYKLNIGDAPYCHPTTWLNQGRWADEYGNVEPIRARNRYESADVDYRDLPEEEVSRRNHRF